MGGTEPVLVVVVTRRATVVATLKEVTVNALRLQHGACRAVLLAVRIQESVSRRQRRRPETSLATQTGGATA